MDTWRLKVQDNIYPQKFNTKSEAEEFLKTKVPAIFIEDLIRQDIIKIYRESKLLDRNGNPIEVEVSNVNA